MLQRRARNIGGSGSLDSRGTLFSAHLNRSCIALLAQVSMIRVQSGALGGEAGEAPTAREYLLGSTSRSRENFGGSQPAHRIGGGLCPRQRKSYDRPGLARFSARIVRPSVALVSARRRSDRWKIPKQRKPTWHPGLGKSGGPGAGKKKEMADPALRDSISVGLCRVRQTEERIGRGRISSSAFRDRQVDMVPQSLPYEADR